MFNKNLLQTERPNILGSKPIFIGLVLLYLLMGAYFLRHYLVPTSLSFLLGTIALLTSAGFDGSRRPRKWIPVTAFALGLLYIPIPGKTMLFLAFAGGLIYLLETRLGRINTLVFVILLLMSPVFEYVMDVFSFPIRMGLTQVAGSLIGLMEPGTITQGNVIIRNGSEFSVDRACMGLNMLVASLLASVILLGIRQRAAGRQVPMMPVILLLGLVFIFNVIANLFRIILLVWLNIGPDSAMHEVTGLVCLLIYVILPAGWLTRWLVAKFGRSGPSVQDPANSSRGLYAGNIVLAGSLLLIALSVTGTSQSRIDHTPQQPIAGYQNTRLPDNVIKLQDQRSLVYIKSIAGFYASEHHPMICWSGSGFEFHRVQEIARGDHRIYIGTLEKGSEKLYTAWWCQSASGKTTSQLDWRWRSLRYGEQFVLVNVTAASEPELDLRITKLEAALNK